MILQDNEYNYWLCWFKTIRELYLLLYGVEFYQMQGQYILTIDYPREAFQSIVYWQSFPKIWLAIRTLVMDLFGGFQYI